MTKRAGITQSEMKRAIKAATECGLEISEVIMTADSVRLIFGEIDEPPKPDNTAAPKEWPR
ncbi:hypothetical protein [Thalassospira marina]|uniref:Uncharacterized protein n=1 Tax=Thalassospira marina TaxID=2048283 RepID=A0A2N3KX74_9PROT|nr:hypothetical protein [Thalassospira marina]PKR55076.1 hypothetical protein COO20_06730 [Thalassospira marina]